ncbi:NAD(P)/FAD-dependent oxidoreductase [Candidatus Desantisbacteria bacterium CG_4_10_14_0_8_um_filter_48_22]|uniref:NAD(P)/FAD-dependent oxidoreductase n=1 Tax=Candidatus Desantisbacteria bacterium CG_4_10_14_0_8_um_filter_48_22 TaxID=1974543 RepID=A0A2M7S4E4_9BACT|nr:MAG: NAD(P)/FAD-dependent oxidoreductase [Candidatus Desantisbacteria bacterium CG_4_10_14_0_8_um_filter_48_22]
MMEQKKVIIIGAGIAGLSAGCYLAMNGYKVKIFEMHDKPGGLCTAWTRNGYTFDGSCHWVVGSNPKSSFNILWRELGIAGAFRFVEHEEFARYEGPGGKTLILYADLDKLEKHMLELAPEDEEVIKEFISGIRILAKMEIPVAMEKLGFFGTLKVLFSMLPFFGVVTKYGKISVREFSERFKNPFMREVFHLMFDNMPDCPVTTLMMPIAWMSKKDAGHPVGGSLKFARAIEKRFISLGGEIYYKKRAKEILVENNKAAGVKFEDDSAERADMVISAADGRTTIFDMLGGKYADDKVRGYYKDLTIWPPVMQVSLGVATDFAGEPHSVTWRLEKPVSIGGKDTEWMNTINYFIDPDMAPPGKTCLVSLLDCDYEFWKELSRTPARYEEEKKRAVDTVAEALEKRYPGIKGKIEAADVATPLTFERYTGNQRGAIQGWTVSTKQKGMMAIAGLPRTLPGLENFYMIGQWVKPGGGLPTGAMHGRQIAQTICKKDGRRFVATTP